MKKVLFIIAATATMLVGCTPDTFDAPREDRIPSVASIEAVINVDQTTNQVTFSLPAGTTGMQPIWILQDSKGNWNQYATVNGYQKIFATAGDKQVRLKLMNYNGISDEYKQYTFHIDNTLIDFNKYYTLLSGGTTADNTKEWRMNNEEAAHFGCGPAGTTGLDWWKAGVDEKKAFGIYDNRITFSGDGKYTYDPGTAGTMYVNAGVAGLWPEYENSAEDYTVPMQATTVDFEITAEGDDLFITLPSKTPFLYVPYVDSWENPRFKIESITPKLINLIAGNDDIAWHFVMTSGAAATVFEGYNYKHEANIWRGIDEAASYTTSFWYAPGWSQIADPEFKQDGAAYTFTLPSATTDQWQAQCFIIPNDLSLSAEKNYDFSCIISSNVDIAGATVKLTSTTDDNTFLLSERVPIKAYEDYIFYKSDMKGFDGPAKLVLDFGGNGADCEVTVKNIVLKDHAVDDGTVLPGEEEEEPATVEWREADNLLKDAKMDDISYYYAPGWAQIANPETTVIDGGYKLVLPEATSDQWQCQFTFNNTGIQTSADKKYDIRVILNSTGDMKATVKFTQQDDDNTFLTADRHDLTAYEEKVIEIVGVEGKDISNLKIVYDFGGNPAGTEVTVTGMLLQEHQASASEMTWDATAADNMWTTDMVPNFFWYAPGWAQIADPEFTVNDRTIKLHFPEATTDQWQAQMAIKTALSVSADEVYDFQVILTATKDQPGVTIKLTEDGDDNNFFFADRHVLTAYEPYVYRVANLTGKDMSKVNLFLDFGGCPADSDVEISDIILRKH